MPRIDRFVWKDETEIIIESPGSFTEAPEKESETLDEEVL
jgi:hypothetical protein